MSFNFDFSPTGSSYTVIWNIISTITFKLSLSFLVVQDLFCLAVIQYLLYCNREHDSCSRCLHAWSLFFHGVLPMRIAASLTNDIICIIYIVNLTWTETHCRYCIILVCFGMAKWNGVLIIIATRTMQIVLVSSGCEAGWLLHILCQSITVTHDHTGWRHQR